jgi:hypothetical protein
MYGIRIPEQPTNGPSRQFSSGEAILDSDGNFALTGLVPQETYEVMYRPPGEPGKVVMRVLSHFTPTEARQFDLGKIVYLPSNAIALPAPPKGDELERALKRQHRLSDLLVQTAELTDHDFAVRRAPGSNTAVYQLPRTFGGMLQKVPGVKSGIEYLLLDLIDFKDQEFSNVVVIGSSPGRSMLTRLNVPFDRHFSRNEKFAMVGANLANKLGKKIGDAVEVNGNALRITAIYTSPLPFENDGMVIPLKVLQDITVHPDEVTAFAITAERPIDEAGLEELRQHLEAVQPGLEVTLLHRTHNQRPAKP